YAPPTRTSVSAPANDQPGPSMRHQCCNCAGSVHARNKRSGVARIRRDTRTEAVSVRTVSLGIVGLHEAGESVELSFPECAVLLDPFGCRAHRLRLERTAVDPTIARAPHESRLLEHAQVLRDRRPGNPKRARELANRCLPESETTEDGAAGGVAKGGEGSVELG